MSKRVITASPVEQLWFAPCRLMLKTSLKWPAQQPFGLVQLRRGMGWMSEQMGRLMPRHTVRPVFLDGVACERHDSDIPSQQGRVMLYLHGGAFFAGSPATHRALCAQLAHAAQMPVVVPDYRLAPEYPFPAALMDVYSVYQALREQGYRADQIVVAGDSAGGGLALMLAQKLRIQAQPMPSCLLLLSPYLDYTFAQRSHQERAGREAMLSVAVLQRGIEALQGESGGPSAAELSPLSGDLSGLPPLCIQVGTEEILYDDAIVLAEQAKHAGTEVRLEVYEGLWHVFQLFAPQLPMARRAVAQLGRWARADWSTPVL